MGNQIFIPTFAKSKEDVNISLEIQKPLIARGYKPGLMLVIKDGIKGVIEDAKLQYDNLKNIDELYGSSAIVIMLSNIPIEEIDFLNNTKFAVEHVKNGINFAKELPIGKRKILTFHLNSLVKEEEFLEREKKSWVGEFDRIIVPALKKIASYAKEKGIEVKVETDPVPCYGDVSFFDKREYRGKRLNELRSPFYLTGLWGFNEIRDCGLGICLDICHNRTIYKMANSDEHSGVLHSYHVEDLRERLLFDDVRDLESSDLVHLNDGFGTYSKKNGNVFLEGVTLGEGDIEDLDEIIRFVDDKGISWVLEVNEKDFKNRLNTRKSIEYILGIKNGKE